MNFKYYVILLLAMFLYQPTFAFEEGVDHPLVERYPGTTIRSSFENDLVTYKIALGAIDEDAEPQLELLELEGKLNHIIYAGDKDDSILRVYKSLRKTIEDNGFELLYSCNNQDCGGDLVAKLIDKGVQNKYSLVRYSGPVHTNFYYLASKQNINGVDHYLVYFIYKYSGNKIYIGQDILVTETDEVVGLEVDLDFSEIKKSGKVVLNGVFFETNSATITSESEKSLSLIAEFLQQNPDKEFYVVGHTDSDGNVESNLKLSKSRANSVLEWLSEKNQISTQKLTAYGLGPLSPSASNKSDAGKQKNRRVELVEK